MERPEEFPLLTSFWLKRSAKDLCKLVVYVLFDSPSTVGAYRFEIQSSATMVMNVDGALYSRKSVERLGVALLTRIF